MDDKVWTIAEALKWTQGYLATKGDDNPRLSAQYLLSHATGLSRIELYAYFDRPLSMEERGVLREALKKRASGVPLQYAVGEAPFRYLTLKVTPAVLIPRPETEVLVDLVLKQLPQPSGASLHIADVGTGSGCIALALATEREDVAVVASDISPEALEVARHNAETLGATERVSFFEGNLAQPLFEAARAQGIDHLDALVSNPPYVLQTTKDQLPAEVRDFEPEVALFSGEDGLEHFRMLLDQLAQYRSQTPVNVLALELDERMVEQASSELQERQLYGTVWVEKDLAGRNRFLLAKDVL